MDCLFTVCNSAPIVCCKESFKRFGSSVNVTSLFITPTNTKSLFVWEETMRAAEGDKVLFVFFHVNDQQDQTWQCDPVLPPYGSTHFPLYQYSNSLWFSLWGKVFISSRVWWKQRAVGGRSMQLQPHYSSLKLLTLIRQRIFRYTQKTEADVSSHTNGTGQQHVKWDFFKWARMSYHTVRSIIKLLFCCRWLKHDSTFTKKREYH